MPCVFIYNSDECDRMDHCEYLNFACMDLDTTTAASSSSIASTSSGSTTTVDPELCYEIGFNAILCGTTNGCGYDNYLGNGCEPRACQHNSQEICDGNCEWLSGLYWCHETGTDVLCQAFFTQADCPIGRCEFDTLTSLCRPSDGEPTAEPSQHPTDFPTVIPTGDPTVAPWRSPTSAPSRQPTDAPSPSPSQAPSDTPTSVPSSNPTSQPSREFSLPPSSSYPSTSPTISAPTSIPTRVPTSSPTLKPSTHPTIAPTWKPSSQPTSDPTSTPTSDPTLSPTSQPSPAPSDEPTKVPTGAPTQPPTQNPTPTFTELQCNRILETQITNDDYFSTFMLMLNSETSNTEVNIRTCRSEVLDTDLCVGSEYINNGRGSGILRNCSSRSGSLLGEDVVYVLEPGIYPIQLGSASGPGHVTIIVTCSPTLAFPNLLRDDTNECFGSRSILPSRSPTISPTALPSTSVPTLAPTQAPTSNPTSAPTVLTKWICPCESTSNENTPVPCTPIFNNMCTDASDILPGELVGLANSTIYLKAIELPAAMSLQWPQIELSLHSDYSCTSSSIAIEVAPSTLQTLAISNTFVSDGETCTSLFTVVTSESVLSLTRVLSDTCIRLADGSGCPGDTTVEPTTTTLLLPDESCRVRGCNLSTPQSFDPNADCQCESTCLLLGDCCLDYVSFCGASTSESTSTMETTRQQTTTTTTTMITTTSTTSKTITTTISSTTTVLASCVGHCGRNESVGFGQYTCFCEPSCIANSDCCNDFESVCRTTTVCVPKENNCQECSIDGISCQKCRNAHYLHEGACLEQCPTGTSPRGTGNYNRRCITETTIAPSIASPSMCVPREGSCHTCHIDGTACVQCRDSMYLHQGECMGSCPEGYRPRGSGRFNRICEASATVASTSSCQPKVAGCHRCLNSTTCEFCREQQYLHSGECIPTCPQGFAERGSGNFRRFCENLIF